VVGRRYLIYAWRVLEPHKIRYTRIKTDISGNFRNVLTKICSFIVIMLSNESRVRVLNRRQKPNFFERIHSITNNNANLVFGNALVTHL